MEIILRNHVTILIKKEIDDKLGAFSRKLEKVKTILADIKQINKNNQAIPNFFESQAPKVLVRRYYNFVTYTDKIDDLSAIIHENKVLFIIGELVKIKGTRYSQACLGEVSDDLVSGLVEINSHSKEIL